VLLILIYLYYYYHHYCYLLHAILNMNKINFYLYKIIVILLYMSILLNSVDIKTQTMEKRYIIEM